MQAIMETIFDSGYLLFAIGAGAYLLWRSGGQGLRALLGVMCVILGCGDAFHLVPRVMHFWLRGDFTAALGFGTQVTSITMTVFYLLLEYARRISCHVRGEKAALWATWALAAVRLLLCLMPQNRWTAPDAPLSWGIIRNIPFAVMGAMAVALWLRSSRVDKTLRWLWLAVLLSFLFYFPVVLFADALPIIGMMMLPKTCMYIWMMVMFLRLREEK